MNYTKVVSSKKSIGLFLVLAISHIFLIGKKLDELNCYSKKQYYCVAADENFFSQLLQLIGSIHATNFERLQEIAVFDLGFTQERRNFLKKIQKLNLYNVEITNPDILRTLPTKFFQSRPYSSYSSGKFIRGWYSWKPVVVKQAAEKFPYFLYLDAGCVVLQPLDDLFLYIQDNGYCLVQNSAHDILGERCTDYVARKFNLFTKENEWILKEREIMSGIQGYSSKRMADFISKMYELTKDISNFQDDGTALLGFGEARHDQALLSVNAYLARLMPVKTKHKNKKIIKGTSVTFAFSDKLIDDPHVLYHNHKHKDMEGYIRFQ